MTDTRAGSHRRVETRQVGANPERIDTFRVDSWQVGANPERIDTFRVDSWQVGANPESIDTSLASRLGNVLGRRAHEALFESFAGKKLRRVEERNA